jgi:hypothetical protein
MPLVQFTDSELLRGKIYPVDWYLVRIDEIGTKPAKNGESTNFPVTGTIIKNAETGDTTFANHPIEWMFNSKAMGFAVGFFTAMGIEVEANKRYDLGAFAGKFIEVFIENDIYEGRQVNRVNHKYRPAQTE